MDKIEEILAALDDSDDDKPDEPTSEDTPPKDNSAIKQIRAAVKEWEKRAKAAEAKVQEYETKEREATVKGVFKELELPEKQAALFLKTHEGDVTADAIKQFVVDYGLKDEVATETGGTTEEKSQGFQPGGTGGGIPEPKVYSLDEAKQLVGTDPGRLESLIAAGRVQLDVLPGNVKK